MAPTFAEVQGVYAKLWDELVPTAAHMPELEKIAERALAHKTSYQAVAETVWNNPDFWYVVALIDQMEGGGGANTYLGNGQSLSRPTTEVPSGRGPFANFHDGAVDALRYDHLDKVHDWSPASLGYHLELYNGEGYMSKPIVSPYIASWSNKYTSGKYIRDHDYDPNAVSQQPGALTILKVLATLDKTINLGAPPTKESPPVTTPAIPDVMAQAQALTKMLENLMGWVAMIAPWFPPAAPLVPFIPVIQSVLKTLEKVEAAGGDPMAMLKIIEADFATIKQAFDTAMGHPTVKAAMLAATEAPTEPAAPAA